MNTVLKTQYECFFITAKFLHDWHQSIFCPNTQNQFILENAILLTNAFFVYKFYARIIDMYGDP